MACAARLITLYLLFAIGLQLQPAAASPEAPFSFRQAKARLADVRISAGPEIALVSSWGPDLYRRTVDAVVLVLVPESPGSRIVVPSGSGVLVGGNCLILTNWHVVGEHHEAAVIFRPTPPKTYADLTDKDLRQVRVVKKEQPKDLALLRLTPCPREAKHLLLEDTDRVQVGQDVFAIGHPEGLHWTYTEGVISQIRPRYHWAAEERRFIATVIQTQTPVSYGSSGGPLINMDGKLVGVISNSIPGAAGFNFAIAAHELKTFLAR